MSIILQRDSRAGVTYAYHNTVIWDKALKKSSSSRILIGKLDPQTGEVVKSSGHRRKKQIDNAVIDREISEYNKKVREKKKVEDDILSGSSQEIRNLKQEFADIQAKMKECNQIILSAVQKINQLFDDNAR